MSGVFTWVTETLGSVVGGGSDAQEPDPAVRSSLGILAGATMEDFAAFGRIDNSEAASRLKYAMTTAPGR